MCQGPVRSFAWVRWVFLLLFRVHTRPPGGAIPNAPLQVEAEIKEIEKELAEVEAVVSRLVKEEPPQVAASIKKELQVGLAARPRPVTGWNCREHRSQDPWLLGPAGPAAEAPTSRLPALCPTADSCTACLAAALLAWLWATVRATQHHSARVTRIVPPAAACRCLRLRPGCWSRRSA